MAKTLWVNGFNGTTQVNSTTTVFFTCACSGQVAQTSANEAQAKIIQHAAGTLADLQITVASNSMTDAVTLITRKNGADGGQSITIAGGATGQFSDASGSDTIANNDTVNYKMSSPIDGGPGNLKFGLIATTFAATTNTVVRYAAVNFPDLSDGNIYYFGLSYRGDTSGENTTEALVRFDTNAVAVYKNMYVYVSTNANVTGGQLTLNQNGVNTTVTITIPALTTGVLEDDFSITGNSVTTAANDDMNYEWQSPIGLALTMQVISIAATSTDKTSHSISYRVGMGVMAPGLTRYYVVGGGGSFNDTEAFLKAKMKMAATTSNLVIYVSSNTI